MPLPLRTVRRATGRATRLPLVVAHRGASADAPENTLAAVRRAVALGADLVEVDVQRTRDGQLICMHDATVTRTTDCGQVLPGRAPWRVADLTAAELARLDAGRGLCGQPEPVPTLAAVLDALAGTGVGLQLELKLPGSHPGIVDDLAAALAAGPPEVAVTVQSFDVVALKEVGARAPHLPLGMLGRPPRAHLPVIATWAQQVNPPHRRLTASYVAAVHRAGMRCLAWTVDTPADVRRVVAAGVDGVITNVPDRAAAVVRSGLSGTGAPEASRGGGTGPWRWLL